jgi:DNA-binding phage protein
MAEGKTAAHAAKTVGWSKASLYRSLKPYGEDPLTKDAVVPKRTTGRSKYVGRDTLPPRD